jgi:hypothetical protein
MKKHYLILILLLTGGCATVDVSNKTGLDYDLEDDGLANNSIKCMATDTPVPHEFKFDEIVEFCNKLYLEEGQWKT